MADGVGGGRLGGRLGRASVRLRTTLAAALVVAIALLLGGFVLVSIMRGSLEEGLETSAEERASSIVDQIETQGLPVIARPTLSPTPRPTRTETTRTIPTTWCGRSLTARVRSCGPPRS